MKTTILLTLLVVANLALAGMNAYTAWNSFGGVMLASLFFGICHTVIVAACCCCCWALLYPKEFQKMLRQTLDF